MRQTGKKSPFIIHFGLMIIFLLAVASSVNAQNSDFINWETTARDATGQPIHNQEINVQAALHFKTPTSISRYVENHRPTTNAVGIFKIEIGNGTPVAGSYDNLPWGRQDSFIEISINGVSAGTKKIKKNRSHNRLVNTKVRKTRSKTRTNSKAAQMNPGSMPVFQINVGENTLKAGDGMSFTGKKPVFTINAKDKVAITAGEGINIAGAYPNYTVELKKHFIGEEYLGGTVFYVQDNGQHGLIAGKFFTHNTWAAFRWNEPGKKKITYKDFKTVNSRGVEIGDGKINTYKIRTENPVSNVLDVGEPKAIIRYHNIDWGNWYVPSLGELRLVYKQKSFLAKSLKLSGKYHTLWSSTEGDQIAQGHGDNPSGGNYASGKYFKGYGGTPVVIGLGKTVTGVYCINFYTGYEATIAKTHDLAFILIRDF